MMRTGFRWLIAAVALAALVASGAEAGSQPLSILGMAWTPAPAPALVVSASGPLSYRELDATPGELVLELGDAVASGPIARVSQPGSGLLGASLEAVEGGSRLRLALAEGWQAAVATLPAGLEVRFTTAPVAGGDEVSELLAVADESGVTVMLGGNGPLVGKAFTLPDPPRLVVDFKGTVNRVAQRVHAVDAAGVRQVRIAQFAAEPDPIVRVAVDLDERSEYRLETTPRGAVLRIGPEPLRSAAAPAMPAPEPAPEAVPPPAPVPAQPVVVAQAETDPVSPVTIIDEPYHEQVAQVPPPSAAPAQPSDQPAVEVLQPAASPADSPWTSTPTALVEQASPAAVLPGTTQEVETEERRFTGEPISLELKDADVKDVLRSFAKITGLNIVIDPDVSGSVTVQLENVPWDQALDIILRLNRLDYVVENNVLRVAKLERLTAEKAALAEYRKQEEAAKPMRTVTKTLSYIKASEAAAVLTGGDFLLSERGTVVLDNRNNALIIRDNVDRLEGILNLLDQVDTPVAQVIIEARIVETTKTFSRALGVAWNFSGVGDVEHGTTTGLQFPHTYEVNTGVDLAPAGFGTGPGGSILGLAFGDILDAFNLEFVLSAAETNGLAKIVSSPKVMAQNNQLASIQSGIQIPVQTVANNTVTVQYIDATLQLNVLPQITAEGTVILDIDIKKREPLQGINLASATNVPISTRDARTRLMVRDGGTTVIGGIYKATTQDQKNQIPLLGDLPIIGNLFRSSEIRNEHDELLIFITPRIVKY